MGLIRKSLHVVTGGIVAPHSLKQRQHGSPGRTAHSLGNPGNAIGAFLDSGAAAGRERIGADKAGMSVKEYRRTAPEREAARRARIAALDAARDAGMPAGLSASMAESWRMAKSSPWHAAYYREHGPTGTCSCHEHPGD